MKLTYYSSFSSLNIRCIFNNCNLALSTVVTNRIWGKLFGYEGTFDAEYIPVNSMEDIPKDVLPIREEIRE